MSLESAKRRLADIEHLLGIDGASSSDEISPGSLDLTPLRRKLQELKLGFITQVPAEQLHRLRASYREGAHVSTKDKLRSINFSSELTQRRAEMLQQVQRSSDLVLNSTHFGSAEQLTPELGQADEQVKRVLDTLAEFDAELHTFYAELASSLCDLRGQLERLEGGVHEEETKRGAGRK